MCFAECFRFSRSEMRRFAEAAGAIALIAEDGEILAGFIIVQSDPAADEGAYVVTLDVASRFARLGVGSELLRAGESAAAKAGNARMTLHVHSENLPAVSFYERNGYTRTGFMRGFYQNVPGGGDAYVYEKALPA